MNGGARASAITLIAMTGLTFIAMAVGAFWLARLDPSSSAALLARAFLREHAFALIATPCVAVVVTSIILLLHVTHGDFGISVRSIQLTAATTAAILWMACFFVVAYVVRQLW
jgi:hypothetical protein